MDSFEGIIFTLVEETQTNSAIGLIYMCSFPHVKNTFIHKWYYSILLLGKITIRFFPRMINKALGIGERLHI